jgi:hypothetical protein
MALCGKMITRKKIYFFENKLKQRCKTNNINYRVKNNI